MLQRESSDSMKPTNPPTPALATASTALLAAVLMLGGCERQPATTRSEQAAPTATAAGIADPAQWPRAASRGLMDAETEAFNGRASFSLHDALPIHRKSVV